MFGEVLEWLLRQCKDFGCDLLVIIWELGNNKICVIGLASSVFLCLSITFSLLKYHFDIFYYLCILGFLKIQYSSVIVNLLSSLPILMIRTLLTFLELHWQDELHTKMW